VSGLIQHHCCCKIGQQASSEKKTEEPGQTEVIKLNILKPRDHVAWHRDYLIYHHAIVEDIDLGNNTLTVIEFKPEEKKMDELIARILPSIRRFTYGFYEAIKDTMFRIDYGKGCSLPTSETLSRALSRIGETGYNLVTNNCQHFATFCKTGRAESGQVNTLKYILT